MVSAAAVPAALKMDLLAAGACCLVVWRDLDRARKQMVPAAAVPALPLKWTSWLQARALLESGRSM
eukprot:1160671-Pelagomonas_calceolata.AAC.1